MQKLELPGIALTPAHRARLPAPVPGRQLLGSVGTDGNGLQRPRVRRRQAAAGHRRRAPPGQGRARRADLDPRHQARQGRVAPGADDRRRHPGQGRARARRGRREVPAQGRDRDRHGPAHRRDAGAGQLAAHRRQRRRAPRPATPRRTAPSASPTSRARPSRRSPSRARCRTATVTPSTPFDLPPQIQVADRDDRRVARARARDADDGADPRPVLATSARSRSACEMGKQRFDHWVRRFGFGKPTGVDLPGEERGIVLPVEQYSGSSMGNLPIGQGLSVTPMQMAPAYSAIANGGILRPPRVVRRVDGKLAAAAQGHAHHLARARRPSCARCSRACSRPAAPPARCRSPATSSRARPARRTRSTPPRASTRRPTTSPRSWASRPRCTRGCSSA